MSDTDPMPDPETPEWPVAWAAKEVLRRHLGPKFDRRLPLFLARAILERMRLTKWRISKEPPAPPHSTPGEQHELCELLIIGGTFRCIAG
jgi:hypothetical protein